VCVCLCVCLCVWVSVCLCVQYFDTKGGGDVQLIGNLKSFSNPEVAHACLHTHVRVSLYVCNHACMNRAHTVELTHVCMHVYIYQSVHLYAGAKGHRSDNIGPDNLLHVMDQDDCAVSERLLGTLQYSQICCVRNIGCVRTI